METEITDWSLVLKHHMIIVRNIISDTDKIYTLGEEGYVRCYNYSEFYHKLKYLSKPKHIIFSRFTFSKCKEQLNYIYFHK